MEEQVIHGAAAMRALGARVGGALRSGGAHATIVTLSGDLGAGKTTLAQGILTSLGAAGPFTSPTFGIIKMYALPDAASHGFARAYHVDPYRVCADDIRALGWGEMAADARAVIIVEWPSRIAQLIPADVVRIDVAHRDAQSRVVTHNVQM